jgi:hypothetical protein
VASCACSGSVSTGGGASDKRTQAIREAQNVEKGLTMKNGDFREITTPHGLVIVRKNADGKVSYEYTP